jgi:small GTP-binding protein
VVAIGMIVPGPRKEKVVMIGPPGCGKTAIANRIAHDSFRTNTVPTVGAAFLTKMVMVEGVDLRLDIWDTGGSEKYRALAPMYYREARAAIVVFDVTDHSSPSRARGWIEELRVHARKDIILAGAANKIDLDADRKISSEDVETFGSSNQLKFCMEVSAKTGVNIEELLASVCKWLVALPTVAAAASQVAPEYITGSEEGKCGC